MNSPFLSLPLWAVVVFLVLMAGCGEQSKAVDATKSPAKPGTENTVDDEMASRVNSMFKNLPEASKTDRPAFSLGDGTPAPADSSASKVTDGTTPEVSAQQGVVSQGATTATDSANSGDINRLMDRLQKLHSMQLDVQSMEQFQQIQIERLEKSTQVLALNPSYEFQVMAIKTQIDALSWQDGTDQPGAAERLEQRCQELLQSENLDFRRMGMLGQTGAFMRRYAKTPSIGVAPLVASIQKIMPQDFDDFELATELAQTASAIFVQRQRADSIQVMTALRDCLRNSQQLPVIGIADSLSAQIAMAEVEFDKLIKNQVADEEKNLPALRAGMEKIVSTGATVSMYNEMIPWMQLFEQQACYRSTGVVAEVLETAFRQIPSDPSIVEVLSALQPVRQRMQLIGNPLEWSELVDYKGGAFDGNVLKGKVVLVTFFSGKADKPLRDQLQFETKMFEELQDKGFAMVGFNIDPDPNSSRDFFGSRLPRWHCLQSSNPAKLGFDSVFAVQTVANQVPYRLLLGRDGKVVHLGIPIDRLGKYVTDEMQK
ncbi:MAG: hypothetical protein Q8M16_20600 [Pirellulaceae bacterium]|nr:hypothetical protein [Pirellulaceae bacterium]